MSQPKLITKPFASDALPGYVNEIPKENPSGAPEQNASWAVGFPPITMTDLADGGLPPNGEDMNGVLRAITEHNLFIGGGGVYKFTSEYISEVGGYSKGAVLISDDKTALWMSIQDNNTQNFNGETKNQWRRIAFTALDLTLSQIQDELNGKVDLSGDQTVSGIKKFTSFPVTPSDAPTANYQAANKKYVDDSVAVPVDQIFTFESALPPEGYIARNGQAIDSARMPKLFARYGSNMPDDRNRVYRMQGDLTGAVGSLQEDEIQRVTGGMTGIMAHTSGSSDGSIIRRESGLTRWAEMGDNTELKVYDYVFDSSLSVRSGNETRVKSRIVIFCNKIQ